MKIIIKRCARAHNLLTKKWSWCALCNCAAPQHVDRIFWIFPKHLRVCVFVIFETMQLYRLLLSVGASVVWFSLCAHKTLTISPKNMIDRIKRSHLCFYAKLALNDSFVRIVNVRLGKFFLSFFFSHRIKMIAMNYFTISIHLIFFANTTNIQIKRTFT